MKVCLVWTGEYERYLVGVFSQPDKALAAIKAAVEANVADMWHHWNPPEAPRVAPTWDAESWTGLVAVRATVPWVGGSHTWEYDLEEELVDPPLALDATAV